MTETLDRLPELPPRNHRWNYAEERRLAASEFPDGNARTLRPCLFCGITKITVHPPSGLAWREWISPKAPDQRFQYEHTPPCLPHDGGSP